MKKAAIGYLFREIIKILLYLTALVQIQGNGFLSNIFKNIPVLNTIF